VTALRPELAKLGNPTPPLGATPRAPHGASLDGCAEPLPHELAGACSCGLVSRGTSVTPTIPSTPGPFGLDAAEWEARDAVLKVWRECRSWAHRERARRARADGDRTRQVWHEQRASALTEPYVSRRDGCGQRRHVRAWCASCGTVHHYAVGCGLGHWCEVCHSRRKKRTRKKLLEGIARAEREGRYAWSRGPRRPYTEPRSNLLTLTIRNTGDAVRDRETITQGWKRLRAWLAKRGLRRVPFVLAWEVTDGTAGVPHVHAHAAVVWPYIPTRELGAAWVRATEGAAEMQGADLRPMSPAKASDYAAKYATKGCDPAIVSRETWVAWVRASATKRSWTTSRGLLTRDDAFKNRPPCCATVLGEWGGTEIRRGPIPDAGSTLPTGPPVSRETAREP